MANVGDTSERGPIYGVVLLDSLPLDGGMRQALPSRADLDAVRRTRINGNDRVVAGYEVLLEHYKRLVNAVEALRPAINDCTDAENQMHGIKGAAMAKRTIRYVQSQIAAVLLAASAAGG